MRIKKDKNTGAILYQYEEHEKEQFSVYKRLNELEKKVKELEQHLKRLMKNAN